MAKYIREIHIKKKIVILLKKYNVWYFMPPAAMYGKKGIPDFICCYHGQFIGVEAKSPNKGLKGLTLAQKIVGKEITDNKGKFFVVWNNFTLANLENYLWHLNDTNTS
jgi:hypothetical protein